MASVEESEELLPLEVDGVQVHVIPILKVFCWKKPLRGLRRVQASRPWGPVSDLHMATKYSDGRKVEGTDCEWVGWDAISRKLSTRAGNQTCKVSAEELMDVAREAIRRGYCVQKGEKVFEVRYCLESDLERKRFAFPRETQTKWTAFSKVKLHGLKKKNARRR
ncbi:MAG: hypothetical protein JSV12_03420 [Candidatus Bathyarchaeota archaeon]|nr:MAG: hypothetical protein JSV12_03420 [Candidatus Bathyarchaeota archaeon]